MPIWNLEFWEFWMNKNRSWATQMVGSMVGSDEFLGFGLFSEADSLLVSGSVTTGQQNLFIYPEI